MIVAYLLLAVVTGGAVYCFRNRAATLFFILLFLVGQTVLTVYAFCHLNERDSTYFTFDSLGVILSFVLALLRDRKSVV